MRLETGITIDGWVPFTSILVEIIVVSLTIVVWAERDGWLRELALTREHELLDRFCVRRWWNLFVFIISLPSARREYEVRKGVVDEDFSILDGWYLFSLDIRRGVLDLDSDSW
jgi:hypothetical protein